MSKTRPFLIGKGAGSGDAGTPLDAAGAAKNSAPAHTLSPAEKAVVTVDLRNSRRDELLIDTSPARSRLAQFVQVQLGVPLFLRLQRLFPIDLAPRIRRGAGHHAREGRFRALVGLIVEITAGDALNKCLLLLPVRKLQVRGE